MTERMRKTVAAIAAAVVICSLCTTSAEAIGYGQGKEVDGSNRPSDAVSFDNTYGQYGAYATTPDRNRIIITFDQGYENGYTAAILDTLREKDVSAIFFLTGDYAKSEPELIHRMIDEGHALGNHGMTHAALPSLSEAEAREEISALHEYVKDEYNYEMQYFRFPCGEYSEESIKIASSLGYKTLFWSYAYVDWQTDAQPDPGESLKGLIKSAHGGEILLLHSVSETNAQILGDAIDRFREMGFEV